MKYIVAVPHLKAEIDISCKLTVTFKKIKCEQMKTKYEKTNIAALSGPEAWMKFIRVQNPIQIDIMCIT